MTNIETESNCLKRDLLENGMTDFEDICDASMALTREEIEGAGWTLDRKYRGYPYHARSSWDSQEATKRLAWLKNDTVYFYRK